MDMLFGNNTVVLLYVFFVIAASVWIFFDTRNRGKSPGEAAMWSIGVLFCSIIVLVAWYWTRPNFMKEKEGFCSECHKIYKGDPVSCPNCGHMLIEGIVDLSEISTGEDKESEIKPGDGASGETIPG